MTARLDFVAPLFVPGHRPERFEKAAASGADAIIIDLEDAVPIEAKTAARAAVRTDFTELPVLVRINAEGTQWFSDDLDAMRDLQVAAIILPKAQLGKGLAAACNASRTSIKHPIVALIETAQGLVDARQVVARSGVERLAFGSIDFCAELGCAHTREALLMARSELVLSSRLAGKLAPLDGVTTSINDAALVNDDARYARALGFGGKLCIHPRQVADVLSGFMPNPAEIAWAHKVLASGDGATALDGAMVDEPVRIRARSILARASRHTPMFRS